MKWLILLLGIFSNAFASVLIKLAMIAPRKFPSIQDPGSLLNNWPFWAGLSLYGIAFLLYSAALARLPLNIAHPILTSGAVAVVAILSSLFFHESFHWSTIFGIVLVICGVFFITVKVV
ncbi:DMT family transporter [Leeia oryzae]|uniref:DMT family transporter n=1 Tax=Leeia oryzae TaxID=356662 RepID=UPI000A03B23B|nr:SMR family transporter [Leeia oryzae]